MAFYPDRDDFAHFVQRMTNANPKGFRSPGKTTTNLTAVQKAAIAAKWFTKKDCKPDKSKRHARKTEAKQATAQSHRMLAEIGRDPKYENVNTGCGVTTLGRAQWLKAKRKWSEANAA